MARKGVGKWVTLRSPQKMISLSIRLICLIQLAELRYNLRSKSKMTESEKSNTAANVLVSIENLESSQRRADVWNDEQMAHLEQELEVLKEELR
ncbi:hypothetical protein HAX54_028033 [Datura stramonium]|uniref:Uncharacterized protein n=1 Tax=Datura stramonium TaxID=4076 RepID=A0ABS8Y8S5_DATST|nr:hypothetical protein [Datura stramonium]